MLAAVADFLLLQVDTTEPLAIWLVAQIGLIPCLVETVTKSDSWLVSGNFFTNGTITESEY